MSELRVVDAWFNGRAYEVPKGEAPGWGLRLFFGVADEDDLYVTDSTSALKTLVKPEDSYWISHWDKFYSIPKNYKVTASTGPKVVHVKGGEKIDIYVDVPTKWSYPYRKYSREQYIKFLEAKGIIPEIKQNLRGKILGCWHGGKPGFADVLLEIANND